MGRPPGSRSTQPLLPSGVPKEAASKSRLVAGRFTFMALLKSIRSALVLTGPSLALSGAVRAVFTSGRESGMSSAETARSKPTPAESHALGEDMGTSKGATRLSSAVALGGRTTWIEILAERMGAADKPAIALVMAGPSTARLLLYLEMKAEFRRVAARRHKVRSTERRQEVIKRGLIRQVDDREAQAPLVVVAMEKVVISHAGIEQVAWSDSRRVVIVILRSRSRYLEPRRAVRRGVARHQWSAQCGENAPAEETSLDLLVCGKPGEIHWRSAVPRKGNGTSHQAAVIAPVERHPGGAFPRLVLHVRGLLKVLVVIDAENRAIAGT